MTCTLLIVWFQLSVLCLLPHFFFIILKIEFFSSTFLPSVYISLARIMILPNSTVYGTSPCCKRSFLTITNLIGFSIVYDGAMHPISLFSTPLVDFTQKSTSKNYCTTVLELFSVILFVLVVPLFYFRAPIFNSVFAGYSTSWSIVCSFDSLYWHYYFCFLFCHFVTFCTLRNPVLVQRFSPLLLLTLVLVSSFTVPALNGPWVNTTEWSSSVLDASDNRGTFSFSSRTLLSR